MEVIIEGRTPLEGEVVVRGSKNAAFKLMIAALLGSKKSVLLNVPRIIDTKITASTIEKLGGKVTVVGEHMVEIDGGGLHSWEIPFGIGTISRASLMFAPPLLYHFGKAKIPLPGGDRLGKRPIDRTLAGFAAMGIEAKIEDGWLFLRLKKRRPVGARYRFLKNTHTGTEHLILLAVFAEGETVLENAAEEPEVDDLIAFLQKLGAKVKRVARRTIVISGVKRFGWGEHSVIPDRNEAVTFACAFLGTGGRGCILRLRPADLRAFIVKARQADGKIIVGADELIVERSGRLLATQVETAPHPGFMTDWQPLWFTLMTQAWGKSTIIERVFPYRFHFVSELIKMGARVRLFNPQVENPDRYYNFDLKNDKPEYKHGAVIWGPTKLQGTTLEVFDIRAGATLLLAGLMAEGKTVLRRAELINRGYERLPVRLQALGAKIKLIKKK